MDWAIWSNPIYAILTLVLWAVIAWIFWRWFGAWIKGAVKYVLEDPGQTRWSSPPVHYWQAIMVIAFIILMGFWSSVGQWALRPQTTLSENPAREQRLRDLDRTQFEPLPTVLPTLTPRERAQEQVEESREENKEAIERFKELEPVK